MRTSSVVRQVGVAAPEVVGIEILRRLCITIHGDHIYIYDQHSMHTPSNMRGSDACDGAQSLSAGGGVRS